jgi:hypothetical protein
MLACTDNCVVRCRFLPAGESSSGSDSDSYVAIQSGKASTSASPFFFADRFFFFAGAAEAEVGETAMEGR